ncbi:MAG: hypothetical protein ABI680_19985 [Chthoniobacteraceae bacterium]
MMDDDFESWEAHAELRDRCDYAGLVRLCEKETSNNPEDLHAVERLGEAYLLNGQHSKAIQVMERFHRAYPGIESLQWIILTALFAQGKTELDFEWSEEPTILRIGPEVANICYEHLRPKRKSRSIGMLHCDLLCSGYLTFTEQQLLEFLQKDSRFDVRVRGPLGAEVRVRRLEGRTRRASE